MFVNEIIDKWRHLGVDWRETVFHWLCWTFGCLYSTYRLWFLLHKNRHIILSRPISTEPSWPIFLPQADRGDVELELLLKRPLPLFLLLVAVQLSLKHYICRSGRVNTAYSYRLAYIHAMIGCLFVCLTVGIGRTVYLLTVVVLCYPAVVHGSRLIWIMVLTLVFTHSVLLDALLLLPLFSSPLHHHHHHRVVRELEMEEDKSYYVTAVLMWCLLRIVMVASDNAASTAKNRDDKMRRERLGFAGYLGFTLYTPCLTGPLLSPASYAAVLRTHVGRERRDFIRLIRRLLTLAAYWIFILELSNRLIPLHALRDAAEGSSGELNRFIRQMFGRWEIAGLVYWAGQYFHVKYVVIYGVGSALAAFDGATTAPSPPRCVAAITSYSQMWQHFDRGLYLFLRDYMYTPLCGWMGGGCGGVASGGVSAVRRLAASAVVFAFVYLWHGQAKHILLWTCINYGCLLIERCGVIIARSRVFAAFREFVSSSFIDRCVALVSAPLFMLSLAGQAGFVTDSHSLAVVAFTHCVRPTWLGFGVTLIFMYCACHVSSNVTHWRQSRKSC